MFKAFYLSFFSKDFYRDIAANWKGPAFGLLFAAVTLHVLFMVVYLHLSYKSFLDLEAPHLVEQIPQIMVLKGQVRIDKSWPYIIKAKDGTTLVRFDNNFDESIFPAGQIWVTADKIHRRTEAKMETYDANMLGDVSVDKFLVEEWLKSSRKWFLAVMFPLFLVVFFVLRMLQVGIYSLIGMLLNKVMHSYLEYPQILRLSVAALVPVLVLDCILMFVYPASWQYLGFFMAMGYLVFGIRANRDLIR